uniref:ribosomal protein S19 n=1 Tax=Chamaemelum nobile TaxID=99037 RepID=UPI0028FCF773|nr:ribosomal protein S19 [Chamaemelum nobile]WNG77823.1 ribosomal protein S19 [Chamaemelum nobile]
MKKKRSSFEQENWVTSSSILPEFVDCSVRIYNGKTPVRCKITEGGHKFGGFASTPETKIFGDEYWTGNQKGKKVKSKRIWHEKGNPISVRLDLNRSSDSSRFSRGRPRKSPKGQSFLHPI